MIEVKGLRKVYGERTVVDGVSFSVEPGEIFGILGPNGAGKTTTVECIGGLRQRDGGTITVAGMDPAEGGPGVPGGAGHPAAGVPAARQDERHRGPRPVRQLLPRATRSGRAAGAARHGRAAKDLLRQAVRRPEAAAVGRAGADRQPAGGDPRRAHHRPGPGRPPRRVGAAGGSARHRRHPAVGLALHGGGRAAVRPGHRHRPRPGHRRRHARGPGRERAGRPADELPAVRAVRPRGAAGAAGRAFGRPPPASGWS